MDNIPIELSKSFIDEFFALAVKPAPKEPVLQDFQEALEIIKNKLHSSSSSPMTSSYTSDSSDSDSSEEKIRPKSVLIVDDLGIITYQLEILFKKLGFETVVSHEINDAIEKFKIQDFGYAIIDLFIPTEREGFILLDELKKLALLCKLDTKIVVMTASSKQEYMDKCKNRGADHYLEKTAGWQKELMDACLT